MADTKDYGVTNATPDGRWTFTRQSAPGTMTKAEARAEADRLNKAADKRERRIDLLANNLLDAMGEAFPDDLPYNLDGPIDNAAWNKAWDEVSSRVDSYLNAIPAKGEESRNA